MGIDWSKLVLEPAMKVFAIRIRVAPAVSQPNGAIYEARGIWSSKPVVIETSTGYHSTNQPTLGIRLADWDAIRKPYPKQRDFLEIDDPKGGTAGEPRCTCWAVVDIKPDGQGGAELELRMVKGPLSRAIWEEANETLDNDRRDR